MALPDWVVIDAETLRSDSRLSTEQVDSQFEDNAALELAITRYVTEEAPALLTKCRKAAGGAGFPSVDAKLAVARPDASDDERATEIGEQKDAFLQSLRGLVIARMYRVQPTEEDMKVSKAHADGRGDVVMFNPRIGTADGVITDLVKALEEIAWLYNINSLAF